MKLLIINAVCGIKSTGRICTRISNEYKSNGYEVKVAYGRDYAPKEYREDAVRIGSRADVYFHAFMSRLFNLRGYCSKGATRKFLQWADSFDPDVLWLHNIHDYFINLDMLFGWIKSRPQMEVKWTQHDCWAFTGGCFHFTEYNCEQWKSICKECPRKRKLLPLLRKTEQEVFLHKKKIFSEIPKMEIICVSDWLASLVRESFLGKYDINVVHNKIDTGIFKPCDRIYFEKNNITDKIVVLGVASAWSRQKGLYDFYSLADILPDTYQIVLVGLTEKQKKNLPDNIIGITKTDSASELASIYSSSDVFVNPTYQDSYPTVNLEAVSCGLTVVSYNTGGCAETLQGGEGYLVETGDIESLARKIKEITERKDS